MSMSSTPHNVYVTAFSNFALNDDSLLTPLVFINWNVIRSYSCMIQGRNESASSFFPSQNCIKTCEDYSSQHKDSDVFAEIAPADDGYMSPESRAVIARLISQTNFPFELDSLSWKCPYSKGTVKQLNSVDDMISQLLEVINSKVALGRKRVGVHVTVKKLCPISQDEFEAKNRAKIERELKNDFSKVTAALRDQLNRDGVHPHTLMLIMKHYDEIRREFIREMHKHNIPTDDARMMEIVAIRESFDQAVAKPRPASLGSIAALEKINVSDGGSSSMCAICVEEISAGLSMSRMPCFHVFHTGCLEEWLTRYDHRCPLCKYELPKRGKKLRSLIETEKL